MTIEAAGGVGGVAVGAAFEGLFVEETFEDCIIQSGLSYLDQYLS